MMIKAVNKILKGEAIKTVRVETTLRYKPILGNFLGLWRTENEKEIGERIDVILNGCIVENDRLFVNGIEVKLPKEVYHH